LCQIWAKESKIFFYEPAKGITISPEQFVKGFGKGSLSLLKNSILGVFGSAAKITGSLGSGVAMLSMDEEYQEKRLQKKHKQASNVVTGVGAGLFELGVGILDGITGIVTEPIKGAVEEGGSGFVKGLGRGLLGVVVKPAVGVFDLASRTTEGIHNTPDALFTIKVEPKRFPRHFPPDNKLLPFNPHKAHGKHTLSRIQGGKYAQDRYIAHTPILTKAGHCFVTNNRVIVLDANLVAVWDLPFQVHLEPPRIQHSTSDLNASTPPPLKTQMRAASSSMKNSMSLTTRAENEAFSKSEIQRSTTTFSDQLIQASVDFVIRDVDDPAKRMVTIKIQVKDIKTANKLVKYCKTALYQWQQQQKLL